MPKSIGVTQKPEEFKRLSVWRFATPYQVHTLITCADCSEPIIAGYVGSGPKFEDVYVLPDTPRVRELPALAYFCETHLARRIPEGAEVEHYSPTSDESGQ